ncbi:iron-containing redox enzyme family protein [Streptomyces phaeochromogenes]|uniref:iron-containing redox enzyme family protein n=1 Tax=Streptomyces phaeochromogenes TaxID=1923 RepID=UPI0033C3B7A4
MTMTVESGHVARMEDELRPYYGIHKIAWRNLMSAHGAQGFWETLGQLYHAMNLGVPLMRAAGRRASTMGPEYVEFVHWCEHHSEEEAPHVEWLLNDFAKAGRDRQAVADAFPEPEILALMGTQFALVEQVDPVAILGYIYVAEGHPNQPEGLQALAERFDLPQEAFDTLLFHTEADTEHGEEIAELIERYATSERRHQAFTASGRAFLTGWSSYFRRLVAQS